MLTEGALWMWKGSILCSILREQPQKALVTSAFVASGHLEVETVITAYFKEPPHGSFDSEACINIPGTESIQWLVDTEQSFKTDEVLNVQSVEFLQERIDIGYCYYTKRCGNEDTPAWL